MTDILITGGRIVDGTGNPWFYGDVAVSGDKIERIAPPGTIDRASAKTVIDATDHVVAPGFIDIQSHSIIPWLTDRRSLSKVTQGVTTEILGEGWTPAPFGGEIESVFSGLLGDKIRHDSDVDWEATAQTWTRFGDWLADYEQRTVSVNFGSFLGGGTIRQYACGERMGAPSADELDTMRRITAEAMEDGAFGVATALIYPPDAYTTTPDLIEIMKVVAKYNGVHITHMRSEGDLIFDGLAETLEIAEKTGVATEIYHLKVMGKDNWPKMAQVVRQITEARAAGLDVAADMYPYDGGGTGITACLPPWTAADGKLFVNIVDPELRPKILAEMMNPDVEWENLGLKSGPENVIVADLRAPELIGFRGKTLKEIADTLGMPWAEAVLHMLNIEQHRIFTMYRGMTESNIELQVKQPWIKFSTDAGGYDPEVAAADGPTHPRSYGTYTKVLSEFVREKGWLTLEDAVRKSSSAVADRLFLRDRGLLRDGMKADIIVFDPDTVIDRATYTDSHQLSVGIRDVFVNGTAVLRDNEHTGAFPGQRVNGPGYRPR